jgi:hypothetical protein
MIFLAAAVFVICLKVFPWWSVWIAALLLGLVAPTGGSRLPASRLLSVALTAAIVNAAMTFIQDGMNYGLIAPRMSALFSLPFSAGVYFVVGAITFVSALLGFATGQVLRSRYLVQNVPGQRDS